MLAVVCTATRRGALRLELRSASTSSTRAGASLLVTPRACERATVQIELLSAPGEGDSRYVLESSRPFLVGRDRPIVAYLAAATVGYNWLDVTEETYRGLAEVVLVDV